MTVFRILFRPGKLNSFMRSINLSSSRCKCLFTRKLSDVSKKFITFDEVVAQRRAEARRSLVVQVNSEASFSELYGYCSKYASIQGVHHYKNLEGEHFMLVEFTSEDNLKEIFKSCSSHQKDVDVIALQSPFLWFRASPGKKQKFTLPSDLTLATKAAQMEVNEDKLFEDLLQCDTVSDQIQMLYDHSVLNDLGVRLRYLVARQVECIFESMYANIAVRPFGSSVNGFGRLGCDLDLVFTNTVDDDMSDPNKRLVFYDKRTEGGFRPWQRHLQLVAEALELRAAGTTRVTRILHARVPIVKYCHHLAGLDCDLCYNNMSGVYMSELLWTLQSLDARVAPLVAGARRWARGAGLTCPQPGRCITNFSLTLLVLHFLQQRTNRGRLLPPVAALQDLARKEDVRIAEDNLNCTFLRDMNLLPPRSYGQNDANLETLLLQFFEFYAQFDFSEKAISIIEGNAVRKPNNLPLYIVNPLDQSLNVSRNVSFEECERLKIEVKNAAWQLEGMERDKTDDWGIISILETKSSRGLKKLLRAGSSHRLVSVKDLFEDNDNDNKKKPRQTAENKSVKSEKSEQDKNKKQLKFKNTHVAGEVYRIQRDKIL